MEKLSLSIQDKVGKDVWHPVHVYKDGLGLPHLLFADNVLLFCEASTLQVQLVMDNLRYFCQAFGFKGKIG